MFSPLPLQFSVRGVAQSQTPLRDFTLFSFLLFSPADFLLCIFFFPVLSHACPPPPQKQGIKETAFTELGKERCYQMTIQVTGAPPLKTGRGVRDSAAGHVLKSAAVLGRRALRTLVVVALSRARARKGELSEECRPARRARGSDGFWTALALSVSPDSRFTPFAASF